jgi:hypothetical protein
MPPNPATSTLDDLFARAEDFANYSLRTGGQLPPVVFATTEKGDIWFLPNGLPDVRAKNEFANTTRLICAAYDAKAVVMALESWMTVAKPGEAFDADTPPSEAFDRREVVVLLGETAGQTKQKLLPIIRTDAGGFFGFGEFDSKPFDNFQGRFSGLLPPRIPDAGQRLLAKAVLAAMGVTEAFLRKRLPNN